MTGEALALKYNCRYTHVGAKFLTKGRSEPGKR